MSNLRVKRSPKQKLTIRLYSDLECLCFNVKIFQEKKEVLR
jgi:hypothetical protein